MWWIIFTAVDLYIGLVVLKTMASSVSDEKKQRMAVAEKVIYAGLVLCVVAIVVKLAKR
jgi:hypothetical protein